MHKGIDFATEIGYNHGMKRLIFFIILAGCIVGSTVVVLFVNGFLPKGIEFRNGNKLMYDFITTVIDGKYKFGASAMDFFLYGMFAFLVLNAGLIFAMISLLLLSRLNLNNIKRFYRIGIWYLVSTILVSCSWIWVYGDISGESASKVIEAFLSWAMIPVVSALLLNLLGLVLSFGRQ